MQHQAGSAESLNERFVRHVDARGKATTNRFVMTVYVRPIRKNHS